MLGSHSLCFSLTGWLPALLFTELCRQAPGSGHLHLPFSLPVSLSSKQSHSLHILSSRCLLKCHVLNKTFLSSLLFDTVLDSFLTSSLILLHRFHFLHIYYFCSIFCYSPWKISSTMQGFFFFLFCFLRYPSSLEQFWIYKKNVCE